MNSVARIYSDDIMGNKAIRIVLGDSHEMLKDKDMINSAVDVDMFATLADDLPTIKDRLSSAILKADTVLTNVNKLLDERNLRNLSDGIASFTGVMANLEQLTGTLNKSRGSITNILNNLDSLSANLNGNSDRINNTLENLYILSDSLKNLPLAETINEIKTTLAKLNSNDGTVGKLMNNDSLYNNLSKTVESLDLLLNDLRKNPKRYLNISVFGRKNK
jgi:phospholipid/cholesterol/gamma-HCH transport system substrate-binding protein